MIRQLTSAFLISSGITAVAYRRRSLSLSGVMGGLMVGTLILGLGGWLWALPLGLFFITSSLLSHFKESEKRAAAEKFEKGHTRDFAQAMANGGLGSLIALGNALLPSPFWYYLYTGVMATVTADTWATELGTLSKDPPRLITTGQVVEVGSSGGVSVLGTAVSFIGGLLIGLGGALMQRDRNAWRLPLIGAFSGLAGSLFDSLLGATVQQIYYCDQCQKETERKLHRCGQQTRPLRGFAWLNNDLVNLFASLVGGITAVALWLLLRRSGRSD
jgi:uncharacterized protein (TIGR00297 family)